MNQRNICCLIFVLVMVSGTALGAFAQQVGATQIAGGRGGSPFADSQPAQGARITEIRVRAGDRVYSVQAIYTLSDGRTSEGVRRGGTGGRENAFRLDGDEYITGISGRYGVTVDCIRIHTNRRTSPTFGGDGGDNDFRLDVPSGSQVTGFVGRSGEALDSIGLTYTARLLQDYSSQTGVQGQGSGTSLAGGKGGAPFADAQPAQGARIAEVRVRAGDTVEAVQLIYALPDGRFSEGTRHGGWGGRENIFALDPDEYITGISGRYGDTVDSIRINTNKRTSPIYGGAGGSNDFRLDVPTGSQAIGFIGRSGDTLDAVGLSHAVRPQQVLLSRTGAQGQVSATALAGGRGGNSFVESPPAQAVRIAEVRVRAGERVDAVQVIYALLDGRTSEGTRHGGGSGRENVFTLDRDEYITGISGRNGEVVDSIRIHTNKRTSASFGGGGGDRDFRLDVPSGSQAIGFVGRSGEAVDSIGLSYAARVVPNYYSQTGLQGQGSVTSLAGGRSGSAFTDVPPAQAERITEVRVRAGEQIASIQMVYALADGRLSEGTRRGGTGGREYSFALDPDEYITAISGRYGDTIDSLRIHTNRRTSPLYGGSGGDRDFRVDVPAGNQATGWTGRAGSVLNAVGLTYGSIPVRGTPSIRSRRVPGVQ